MLQPAQELPPTGVATPLSSEEKQAKRDNTRSALWWHSGHEAASPAWLNGRNSSNLDSHSGHIYSYIGILFTPYNQCNPSHLPGQASQTTLPPIIVFSTLIFFICSKGTLVGSSLNNTRSASLPGVMEPFIFSSKEA